MLLDEHLLYADHKEKYQQYFDFYYGSDAVEGKKEYLPQHPFESDAQYKLRLQLSTYKNLAKPIVSVFSSSVWRRQPIRKILPAFEPYLEDVDGLGFGVDTFFHNMTTNIAANGVCFVLVDSTKVDKTQIEIDTTRLTKRETDALNIRPVFIPISPLDVIAWGHDDNGILLYAVIRENTIKTVSPFEKYERIERYKIWYADRWELYEMGSNQDSGFQKIEEGSHPCGQVPIIAGYFKKRYEMVGLSCFDDILSLLKRAYIMENTLDKSLFDTAFPQQGFFGFDVEDVKNYIRSSSNGLVSADPSAHSEYIEPSGRSFSALESKIASDERNIREIALRMVRQDSKVGESAEAKKLDKAQLDSQLTVFSRNCENFEKNCWRMFGRWLGLNENELSGTAGNDNINITYNRDFDVEKISQDIVRLFYDMRRAGDLSRETFWEILKNGELPLPDDFDAVEEAAKIENDSRANALTGSTFGMIGKSLLNTQTANNQIANAQTVI